MRALTIIAAVAALTIVGTIPRAQAQSQYCAPLQRELASLERSLPKSSRNTRALNQQLNKARADERRSGCRSFFSRKRSGSTCSSIRSRISRLQRQLSGSRRGFFGSGRSATERRRDSVRRALARAGCSRRASSTYRTICVRLCDGYYFPLSNTSSRQRFAKDAEKCMGQYPPGEAALFYHPFPHGDASQAVSLTGERYFDQKYAFAFRKAFTPYCAARLHHGLAALKERVYAAVPTLLMADQFVAAVEERMATVSVPIPISRADWSSDPETIANRAGNFVPRQITPSPAAIVSAGDKARTVGDPDYFAEANFGPPATVAGYKPPELKDFRIPKRAAILPIAR